MSIEMESILPLNSEEEENPNYKVTLLNICWTIIGLLFYLFDIGSDIILAISHFKNRYYVTGACTILVIYLATVMDTVFSFRRKEFQNKAPWFWFQYITLSLVNVWGVKIICSLIVSEYKAYRSQQVSADMYKIIKEKTIRVIRLKNYENTYETLPQILLQMYIYFFMGELASFKLPFLSECNELQTTIDSFYIYTLLCIKIIYILSTIAVNWNKIHGIKVSTMAAFNLYGCIFLTIMVRYITVLSTLFLYPYHTTAVILLHISAGCIYWYYNFSNENQSVHKRWLNSILVGTLWFCLPFFKTKRKRIFLTLNIIHFIGNVAASTTALLTVEMYTSVYFSYCTLYTLAFLCGIVFYFSHSKETGHQSNQRSLPEEETEKLTVEQPTVLTLTNNAS